MKIAYLTAGAAGMFCGSCLHDNSLARALIQQGHDCILIPVYTPIRTDEEDVSIDRIFMGGINVYLQQKLPWLAYTPKWLDAVLNQSWLINPLTRNAGKISPSLLGALTLSMLQGIQGRQRKEFSRLIEWLAQDVKPDVIVLTNLLIGGCIPELRRQLRARIFVTLQGDDIFLDVLPPQYRDKCVLMMRQLVPQIDGFIVHSRDYAVRMAGLLSIPEDKLHVIPLGIDPADFRQSNSPSEAMAASHPRLDQQPNPTQSLSIGYLARMAPEKGLHKLVDAFIAIAKRPEAMHVNLKLAGWMGPQHDSYWKDQQRKLHAADLDGRWEYLGSVDRQGKTRFLQSIDLFCVPTVYAEPKALFLLEAVAAGLSYVQPNHGAFPELHQRLNNGWLFESDSTDSLVDTLLLAIATAPKHKNVDSDLIEEIDIATHARRVVSVLDA